MNASSKKTKQKAAERCRVVLTAPPLADGDALVRLLSQALSGGDVASVFLDPTGLDDATFQSVAEKAVPVIQEFGAAAIILNDTRTAGRVGADGIHLEGKLAELAEAIEKHSPKLIVGTGNLRDRHTALEIGEVQPDYIFFGKIGADGKPEAHSRNLALAEWWSQMIEIPSIVQAGTALESLIAAAETGADFVALGRAVFEATDPEAAVREANRLLDEKAPRFES